MDVTTIEQGGNMIAMAMEATKTGGFASKERGRIVR